MALYPSRWASILRLKLPYRHIWRKIHLKIVNHIKRFWLVGTKNEKIFWHKPLITKYNENITQPIQNSMNEKGILDRACNILWNCSFCMSEVSFWTMRTAEGATKFSEQIRMGSELVLDYTFYPCFNWKGIQTPLPPIPMIIFRWNFGGNVLSLPLSYISIIWGL